MSEKITDAAGRIYYVDPNDGGYILATGHECTQCGLPMTPVPDQWAHTHTHPTCTPPALAGTTPPQASTPRSRPTSGPPHPPQGVTPPHGHLDRYAC